MELKLITFISYMILRIRHDLLAKLSDREVLKRWNLLYPKARNLDFSPVQLTEIQALKGNLSDDSLWITPVSDSETRKWFLSINLKDYLQILDETERELRADKRGSISKTKAQLLERIGINSEQWLTVSSTIFGAAPFLARITTVSPIQVPQ